MDKPPLKSCYMQSFFTIASAIKNGRLTMGYPLIGSKAEAASTGGGFRERPRERWTGSAQWERAI